MPICFHFKLIFNWNFYLLPSYVLKCLWNITMLTIRAQPSWVLFQVIGAIEPNRAKALLTLSIYFRLSLRIFSTKTPQKFIKIPRLCAILLVRIQIKISHSKNHLKKFFNNKKKISSFLKFIQIYTKFFSRLRPSISIAMFLFSFWHYVYIRFLSSIGFNLVPVLFKWIKK